MILWPELSHSDPLVLEYLSENSWSPLSKTIEQITEQFCKKRYGEFADMMNGCWQQLLPLIKTGDWGGYSRRTPEDDKYLEYFNGWYTHQDIWSKPLDVVKKIVVRGDGLIKFYNNKAKKVRPTLDAAVNALTTLACDKTAFGSEFILRDSVDMARTVLGKLLNFVFIRAIESRQDKSRLNELGSIYFEGIELMQNLLSVNKDFSIKDTLDYIRTVTDTNPDFEKTLKRNIGNRYCSQAAYELVAYPIKKEAQAAFDMLYSKDDLDGDECSVAFKKIFADFEKIPLDSLQPCDILAPEQAILQTAEFVNGHIDIF
jgi:hypothetical protein